MKRALVLVAVAFVAMAPKDEPAKTDKDEFQGAWSILKGSRKGKWMPPELTDALRITFSGNKVIIKNRDQSREGTFELDPKKKIKAVTITHAGGKTRSSQGIYVFKQGLLILYLSEPGLPRPKDFPENTNTQPVAKGEYLALQRVKS